MTGSDYCARCGYSIGPDTTNTCICPKLTPEQLQRAERFKRLFTRVPLNDCEKLPDPDYGL